MVTIRDINKITELANRIIEREFKQFGFRSIPTVTHGEVRAVIQAINDLGLMKKAEALEDEK